MTANPCPSCVTGADCGTCLERLRFEGATPDPAPCLTCLDVAHLTDAGEIFERVAARLRVRPKSLARHLRRHGRLDLVSVGAQ